MAPFFPNLGFAWIYLGGLFTLLIIASSTDLRQYVIPKWISLCALALGLVGNLLRGAWLGMEGRAVWILGDNGAFVGAVDGLLFAVCGFLVGFALFFLMWILGVCGGGDVKLFGALGACVGAYFAILVLIASLPIILVVTMAQMVIAIFQGKLRASVAVNKVSTASNPKRRVLGFSLPLTIATMLILLWLLRVELHLVAAPMN